VYGHFGVHWALNL